MRPSRGRKGDRVDLLFVTIVRAQGEAQDRDIGEEIPIGSQRFVCLLTDRDTASSLAPSSLDDLEDEFCLASEGRTIARSVDEELTTTKLCLDPVLSLGDL